MNTCVCQDGNCVTGTIPIVYIPCLFAPDKGNSLSLNNNSVVLNSNSYTHEQVKETIPSFSPAHGFFPALYIFVSPFPLPRSVSPPGSPSYNHHPQSPIPHLARRVILPGSSQGKF